MQSLRELNTHTVAVLIMIRSIIPITDKITPLTTLKNQLVAEKPLLTDSENEYTALSKQRKHHKQMHQLLVQI